MRVGIIEKKFVYFKLMQIVLTLAIIWQLMSLHEFCGTFADPKAFLQDITVAHCKSFTLIGKDSKSGKFGAVFNQDKWHDQFFASSSTNDHQPMEEQQQHHQFVDELAAELPPAGRFCIPITISPFDSSLDSIGMDINLLNNDILLPISFQLGIALFSLVLLGIKTIILCSVGFYKFYVLWYAFPAVIGWCISAALSSNLLLNWTNLWTCYNFHADQTIVPLATLVLSIVLACSSVFEILFMNSLLKKKCP